MERGPSREDFFVVAIGGGLGSLLRFSVSLLASRIWSAQSGHWATLCINLWAGSGGCRILAWTLVHDAQVMREVNLRQALNRFGSPFAGAYSDAVVHWQDKDFPVADLAFIPRATAFDDRFDRRFDKLLVDCDLKLYLSQ